MSESETKTCKKCNQTKSISDFPTHQNKKRKDKSIYVLNTCKRCEGEKYNERRRAIAHTEEYKDKAKHYRKINKERHPEKQMFVAARSRARQSGLEFNIERSDLIIPEFCPVLGIKIERGIGKGKKTDASPSLDRIDNSKGYIKGNVMIISFRANTIKNNGSMEEHQKIIDYMLKYGS